MKRCSKCGGEKAESEFYAAKGTRDGLRGECKTCFAARARCWYAANRERVIARVTRWQQENPDRHRATQQKVRDRRKPLAREDHLQRTFGITVADYEGMLEAQGGGCAICGRPPRRGSSLHVDHDHVTGQVRGLLCFKCNGGLGQFGDDLEQLSRAVGYLTRQDGLTQLAVERVQGLRAA